MVKKQETSKNNNYESIPIIYANLNFKDLAGAREDIPLLNTSDDLFKPEKSKSDKLNLLLTRKYDKDNEAFYIYGAISCDYNLLNKEDPMNFVYKQKDNITAYLIYRLVNELNTPVQPKKFITDFNRIKEWYRSCAKLHSNSKWPVYGLINNGTVISLHPPYIAEYLGGAYDFNIPLGEKEKLLENEVTNGIRIIESLSKFSNELFFKFGLMDDIKYLPDIKASILKDYIPIKENASTKLKKDDNFKKYLKPGVIENELELIFARPLSIPDFNKNLNEVLEIIRNPDEFDRKCEENSKAFDNIGTELKPKNIVKSEEEIKILAKYGL